MTVLMVRSKIKEENVAEGEGLKGWVAEPPAPEQATVVGSYGLFD